MSSSVLFHVLLLRSLSILGAEPALNHLSSFRGPPQIAWLEQLLAGQPLPNRRDSIQLGIETLRTWPEESFGSRRLDPLDQTYGKLREYAAAERTTSLQPIDPGYFVPQLRELLGKTVSQERRDELDTLIKEIEARPVH